MQPARGPLGARSPRLLPPLHLSTDVNGTPMQTQSSSKLPPHKLWSYYHRGCVARDPTPWPTPTDKRRSRSGVAPGKNSQHSSRRSTPPARAKGSEEASVADFLDHHRVFLEDYVIESVSLSDIERWLYKKLSKSYTTPVTEKEANKLKSAKMHKKEIFLDIIKRLEGEPSELSVLGEVARCITSAVNADACRVFKLFPDHPNFVQYFVVKHGDSPNQVPQLSRADTGQAAMVLEAAALGSTLRLSKAESPDKFPDIPSDLFDDSSIKMSEVNHVLYQPILASDGRSSYVVELWRRQGFTDVEEATSANALVWGGLVLHYCSLYLDKNRERNMSDFLLDVVKAIFEEMVSLDQLIKRILEFAQRLVNADRASLFLVDYRNFELVSTVFDLKFEPGQGRDVDRKEIRMPINRGIAGHVALSGETMNIPDVYSDYRFNREVDEKTGYKTINILCMPIKVQGKVIGVVQMVNKRNDESFHHEDEVAFEIFSTFFGLALHHARLYDRIMRKEQKYKVALEVLSYHNTCRENEVEAVISDKKQLAADLNNFYFDPYKVNEYEKCKAVITMFDDLFDLSKFDIMTVTRFILTVKKNYRTVPYHNFDHGWSVAHCMYTILKNDIRKRYNYKVRLALFVACLCHDLDHRGYTNKYMSETASPLAAMYSTSTLEHHHFNITVTILQQDGHNIFSHISSVEYKDLLGCIRQCILATDLAAFFPNLAKMKKLQEENQFTWADNSHRDLAMAISMTAADLSASAKPWEIQIKTVKVIFEEFYDQGDKERQAGRLPIPMMDRNKPDQQPDSQVGFLSQICIPCYNMLYRILPKTKPMYVMALKNLHNWKVKAKRIQRKIENGGEDDEGSEIEDVSEEVLMVDEIEIEEEEEDDQVQEQGEEALDEETQAHVEAVVSVKPQTSPEEASWEEEAVILESQQKIGVRLSRDIEGVWMDEEGVVVKSNGSHTMLKNNLKN